MSEFAKGLALGHFKGGPVKKTPCMRSACSRNVVGIQSDCSPIVVIMRSECSQIILGHLSLLEVDSNQSVACIDD